MCYLLRDMYLGRRLRYNKFVPICTMEGDRLSGGIAPLIFKIGSREIWVVRLSELPNLLPEEKLELGAGWVLGLVWKFWRTVSSIAPVKNWTPDLTAYILVLLLIMLPHADLKIIQMSVLIKRNVSFGLDVFDWWQEFLEVFCICGNFPWSSGKRDFL